MNYSLFSNILKLISIQHERAFEFIDLIILAVVLWVIRLILINYGESLLKWLITSLHLLFVHIILALITLSLIELCFLFG
jgi:hypothetical protein